MFDHIAIEETIKRLGIPMDDVVSALKIAAEYEKGRQRLKSDRKEKVKRLQYQQRLAAEKVEHPDRCFCKEDGIEVERKWEEDGIIDYYTTYSYYDFEHKHPYQAPYYKCSNCGKKYTMEVAIA